MAKNPLARIRRDSALEALAKLEIAARLTNEALDLVRATEIVDPLLDAVAQASTWLARAVIHAKRMIARMP